MSKKEDPRISTNKSNWFYLWQSVQLTWAQFAARTSIHGVKFISDPGGTFFTKLMWIGICIISFITANVLVSTFWDRYKSNPTRMNVETNFGPLAQIAYPAITFCSTNSISYRKATAIVGQLKLPPNVTAADVIMFLEQAVGFINKIEYNPSELQVLQDVFSMNRYDIPSAMVEMKVQCSDLLIKCRWEGVIIPCMKLFRVSMTYNGFCCSFNLAEYNKDNFVSRKPRYFGVGNGLSVILKPNVDANAISKIYSEGIQLLVHESTTYPSDTSISKMLPTNSESLVSIATTVTFCSSQVKALSVTDRECVFAEENSLKYFKGYKEINCDVECRMDRTVDVCDCLPYYYPNYQNFPYCNFTKIECLVDHYFELHETTNFGNSSITCNCPANCNGVYYEVHTDTAPMVKNTFAFDPFYNGVNESHMIVHTFMGSQVYKRLRRDLLTNFISLISNFGGVYSLFLGLSVIGFIEIFYFAFIRLYKNFKLIKMDDEKQKYASRLITTTAISKIQGDLVNHM